MRTGLQSPFDDESVDNLEDLIRKLCYIRRSLSQIEIATSAQFSIFVPSSSVDFFRIVDWVQGFCLGLDLALSKDPDGPFHIAKKM
jgi:hypothetical protein